MANPFATAEGKRIEITNEQTKQIKNMYSDVKKEFSNKVRILSNRTNISSIMRSQYLRDFQKDLEADIKFLNNQLERTIESNMLKVAKSVVEDSNKLSERMGFRGIFTNDYYIPHQAVESIITGQLYDGKWSLSKAIWSDNQKKLNDINEIVAKGMIANKSTYDIAKDLERYVSPQSRKGWDWSKVYPGTSKKIDYNAQRLARTMVSHAYEESFVRSTKDNPFIESYMWLASGSDRMCDICAERDGKIFPKDELPLDHPNGMCTFQVVIDKSYDQIASDLRNWVDGTGNPELNEQLDDFASSLGYNVKDWTGNYVHNLYDNELKLIDINRSIGTINSMSIDDFTDKWGIALSGIKNEQTIANLDSALMYMQDSYGINPNMYINKIRESISLKNTKAMYNPLTRNINVKSKYAKDVALKASDAVHEVDHAVQGYIVTLESKLNIKSNIDKISKEIVSETYIEKGYKLNPKTGLPYVSDVENTLTKYAKDHMLESAGECLSEASRILYEKDVEGEVTKQKKLDMAIALHQKEKQRLQEDLLKKNKKL